MTDTTEASLAERRLALRYQLLAQRQVIAQRLGPETGQNNGFPRSMTMRFLIQRPELLAQLALRLAARLMKR